MAAASDEQSAPPGASAAAGWPLGLGGLGAGLLAEPEPQHEEPWTAVGPSSSRGAAAAASRGAGSLGAMLATCTANWRVIRVQTRRLGSVVACGMGHAAAAVEAVSLLRSSGHP